MVELKIAAICFAYLENAAGVRLLAEYFGRASTVLYVHVDAKVDDTTYVALEKEYPNVKLVLDRQVIFWGGFNTVRAMVAGLEQAQKDEDFDRYLIITEDTIPLLPTGDFLNLMAGQNEYIKSNRTVNPVILDRYEKFFYFDSYCTSARPSRIIAREVSDDTLFALDRLKALRIKRKARVDDLYHGGGWVGMSRHAVQKIIKSFREDIHLRESFEFSAAPEEQYFHTILGKVEGTPLVFADWSRKPTPYVFKSAEEISQVDTQGAPFLRKVPLGIPSIVDFVNKLK